MLEASLHRLVLTTPSCREFAGAPRAAPFDFAVEKLGLVLFASSREKFSFTKSRCYCCCCWNIVELLSHSARSYYPIGSGGAVLLSSVSELIVCDRSEARIPLQIGIPPPFFSSRSLREGTLRCELSRRLKKQLEGFFELLSRCRSRYSSYGSILSNDTRSRSMAGLTR